MILALLLLILGDPQNAMVTLTVSADGKDMIGRGVVVSKEHVVTANHVIEHNNTYHLPQVQFSDSSKARASNIVKRWPERDLAIIKVAVPSEVQPVDIADSDPVDAWSFDLSGKRHKFKMCVTNKGYNYFDYTPRSGESGGPVFADDKLVGIVSGGFFWLENRPHHTWPLRAGRLDVVKEVLK